MSPALSSPANRRNGTLLFDGFEFPDDTNLAEAGWTLTGDFLPERNPSTAGGEGYIGQKRLNTFEGGPNGDDNQGTLSSPAFEITDNYLNFLLGGGGRSDGSLQAELVVDNQVVKTATGSNGGILNWKSWDVTAYRGQQAVLRIKDQATGGWGHLTVDHPVLGPTAALPRSVETTVNLVVDGQIVRTATGSDSENLDWVSWDLRDLNGKKARVQIIDNNAHADAKIKKHRAGDLYDLVAAVPETVKPIGQWNLMEVVQNNGKLDLFLNGTKVVSTTQWDDNWAKMIAESKFKSMPAFGKFRKGKISLQDHGNAVAFRNIKIKPL